MKINYTAVGSIIHAVTCETSEVILNLMKVAILFTTVLCMGSRYVFVN